MNVLIALMQDAWALRDAMKSVGCEHIATVTAPMWPITYTALAGGDEEALATTPVLVTQCVTCNAHVEIKETT